MIKLVANNISKTYSHGKIHQEVLSNINLEFKEGDTYAITGVSGSGKSTLLHILGGLENPTSGNIFFNDHDIYKLSEKKKNLFLNLEIGFVFQFHYLINELNVLENIILPGLVCKTPKDQCISRGLNLLNKIGLEHKAYSMPNKLSGGEQQRVAIARAMFNKPKFIIADEPTGNLDEDNVKSVINLFLECINQWGLSLIIASHDKAVYEKMNKRFNLYGGKLELAKP